MGNRRFSSWNFVPFGLIGLAVILYGLMADGPYLAHYHGQPYMQYPGLVIGVGTVMLVTNLVWWWRNRR